MLAMGGAPDALKRPVRGFVEGRGVVAPDGLTGVGRRNFGE